MTAVTARRPCGVVTMSPGSKVSMTFGPNGVLTGVPATKHVWL